MALEHLKLPKPHLPTKELVRIFSKIRISEAVSYRNAPCWEWTGTLNHGYGYISWKRFSSPVAAYRLLYAWLVGPLPDKTSKMELDHLCKNTRCVNPIHLELVTQRVNLLRSNNPTARNARKTHCTQGHPLEDGNLVLHYLPRRYCLTCRQRWNKTKRVRPDQAAYNAEYRLKNAEQLREQDRQRCQTPERREYMRRYLREYRKTYQRKPKSS